MLAAAILLAGCEGSVTIDLASSAPADPAIDQVLVNLNGVQFRGGGSSSLEFEDTETIDLNAYGTEVFRMFTEEEIDESTYTGVRLLFDTDSLEENRVILLDGTEVDLVIGDIEFSDVRFEVDEDASNQETIALTLDLRQSLRFDDDNDVYVLTPVMRAIRAEDAAAISGGIFAGCRAGTTLAEGGAVYLFLGEDVTPDDLDIAGAEPYLTTFAGLDPATGGQGYSFPFVPEGDFTLALTCRGNEDDPLFNDELDFVSQGNLSVEAGDTAILDLN